MKKILMIAAATMMVANVASAEKLSEVKGEKAEACRDSAYIMGELALRKGKSQAEANDLVLRQYHKCMAR